MSNIWRSLETPLINCKVYLELNWIEECILSSARNTAQFEITDAKLYVPIVTLSTKDSAIFTKQLNGGFKRSFYWNSYETRPAKVIEQVKNIDGLLANYLETTKRLFVFADAIAASVDDNPTDRTAGIKVNKKYFLPRGKIENYNVLIYGRNFYDQPIKHYDEIRKVSTGHGDDYTTGCLLDYACFKDNCRLITVCNYSFRC